MLAHSHKRKAEEIGEGGEEEGKNHDDTMGDAVENKKAKVDEATEIETPAISRKLLTKRSDLELPDGRKVFSFSAVPEDYNPGEVGERESIFIPYDSLRNVSNTRTKFQF